MGESMSQYSSMAPSKNGKRKSQDFATKLADPALLEKIDSLFEANVGGYVNLPQVSVQSDTLQ